MFPERAAPRVPVCAGARCVACSLAMRGEAWRGPSRRGVVARARVERAREVFTRIAAGAYTLLRGACQRSRSTAPLDVRCRSSRNAGLSPQPRRQTAAYAPRNGSRRRAADVFSARERRPPTRAPH